MTLLLDALQELLLAWVSPPYIPEILTVLTIATKLHPALQPHKRLIYPGMVVAKAGLGLYTFGPSIVKGVSYLATLVL